MYTLRRRRTFVHTLHLRTPELGGERIGKLAVLLRQVLLHSLEAKIASCLDIIDHNTLGHIAHQLGGVQLIVGTARLDYLGLLLNREVGVSVGRVNVLLVQIQNLIVRDNAGVGEVVHTGETLLRHGERCGEHLCQHSHGVGNVHNPLVLDDLRHKVAVDEIIRDGHTNPQSEAVGIALEHLLHVSLGFAIERLGKVGKILLREADSGTHGVLLIVLKDAAGGVDGAVDALHHAEVRYIESANDIDADRLWLVILTPIDIGAASNTRRHEDVAWLDLFKFGLYVSPVFNPRFGKEAFHPYRGYTHVNFIG